MGSDNAINMNAKEYSETVRMVLDELCQTVRNIEGVDILLHGIRQANRLFFAGAGRSRLALGSFAMRLMQFGWMVYMVGDITTPAIREGDLLIIASGSGETATMSVIAQKAHMSKARVLLITRHAESSIADMADALTVIPDVGTTGKQVGAASFEQAVMLLGDLCVCILSQRENLSDANEEMFSRHANLE